MRRAAYSSFTLDDFATRSPAMQRCLALAAEAARTDIPILLQGETGTGKTLLAQAIHNSSSRAAATFISFNASAMSDTLLESQLFGHEKGAFTGATSAMRGKFEIAHDGTLFFDEIADMSNLAQAKILRAVEYGEFERLGSEVMRFADVRIVSATNRPLRRLCRDREFREDLYHRLNGLTLHLPALRDRQEDLPGLIAAELKNCAVAMDKPITAIEPAALDLLLEYGWPGNLRELHRAIQAIVLFADSETIRPGHILLDQLDDFAAGDDVDRPDQTAPRPPVSREDLSLDQALLRHIAFVYEQTGRNKRQTAKLLDVSRSTLDRKLAQLGL